jgi:hypothetical protein
MTRDLAFQGLCRLSRCSARCFWSRLESGQDLDRWHFPSRIAITAMVWIADSYDKDGFGLAGSHASPTEEVLYLLGPPFQDLPLRRRPENLASTILDLASVLEEADLLDVARNEFLAVDIVLRSSRQMTTTGSIVSMPASIALSQSCRTKSIGNRQAVGNMLRITNERSRIAKPKESTRHGTCSRWAGFFATATL